MLRPTLLVLATLSSYPLALATPKPFPLSIEGLNARHSQIISFSEARRLKARENCSVLLESQKARHIGVHFLILSRTLSELQTSLIDGVIRAGDRDLFGMIYLSALTQSNSYSDYLNLLQQAVLPTKTRVSTSHSHDPQIPLLVVLDTDTLNSASSWNWYTPHPSSDPDKKYSLTPNSNHECWKTFGCAMTPDNGLYISNPEISASQIREVWVRESDFATVQKQLSGIPNFTTSKLLILEDPTP